MKIIKRICETCVYWETVGRSFYRCSKNKHAKHDFPACEDYIEDVKTYLKRQKDKATK